jgi:hypothetical protein
MALNRGDEPHVPAPHGTNHLSTAISNPAAAAVPAVDRIGDTERQGRLLRERDSEWPEDAAAFAPQRAAPALPPVFSPLLMRKGPGHSRLTVRLAPTHPRLREAKALLALELVARPSPVSSERGAEATEEHFPCPDRREKLSAAPEQPGGGAARVDGFPPVDFGAARPCAMGALNGGVSAACQFASPGEESAAGAPAAGGGASASALYEASLSSPLLAAPCRSCHLDATVGWSSGTTPRGVAHARETLRRVVRVAPRGGGGGGGGGGEGSGRRAI